MDAWEVVAALSGAGGAVIAAWAAYQSRLSAREANRAATSLADIERDRRHSEMTPQLRVSCLPPRRGEPWMLGVTLLGPPGLNRVDELKVMILDPYLGPVNLHLLNGTPPRKLNDAEIWSAYKFMNYDPDQYRDSNGRFVSAAYPLPLGESVEFALEATTPPPPESGWTPQDWRSYIGERLRLALGLSHKQYGNWTITCELDLSRVTHNQSVTTYAPMRAQMLGEDHPSALAISGNLANTLAPTTPGRRRWRSRKGSL